MTPNGMRTDRPGCFGSALCHRPSSAACRGCHLLASCGQAARERARALRERFGVSAMLGIKETGTSRGLRMSGRGR